MTVKPRNIFLDPQYRRDSVMTYSLYGYTDLPSLLDYFNNIDKAGKSNSPWKGQTKERA